MLETSTVEVVRSIEATLVDPDPRWIEWAELTGDPVYRLAERLLAAAGLDAARAGRADWNPLGDWLRPGETVVVKPNLVHHRHYRGGKLHWVITDPRLIRAVCDYAARAVGSQGQVILGDAPLQSADWEALLEVSGLERLPAFYARQGYRLRLADFRMLATTDVKGVKLEPRALEGDPNGYRAVDLGSASLHAGRPWERYRVTNYDPASMRAHHNSRRHEYLVSGSVLNSSALISLPKLKTHRKSGLTCALKNLVGINGCKDWLPHHSAGAVAEGGDEYAGGAAWKRLSSWIVGREETARSTAAKLGWNAARKVVWKTGSALSRDASWEGSWHGNDTLWRTIVDLNRAAMYADRDGVMQEHPARRIYTIVDAVLAGEGEGPMAPSPVPMGCLLTARNPLAAEVVSARMARWPEGRLRHILGAFQVERYPLARFSASDVQAAAYDFDQGRLTESSIEAMARWLEPTAGYRPLFDLSEVTP